MGSKLSVEGVRIDLYVIFPSLITKVIIDPYWFRYNFIYRLLPLHTLTLGNKVPYIGIFLGNESRLFFILLKIFSSL